MIRGFIVGSLGLIVLYVLVQDGTAEKVASAGGITTSMLSRWLSPAVPAIPIRGYSAGGVAKAGASSTSSGTAAGGVAGSVLGGLGGGLAGAGALGRA